MAYFDSFSGFIQHFASKEPHAPAFLTAAHEEMSYASLAQAMDYGREALADLGVVKSACVALVMEGCLAIAAMIPLLLDTACCAPLNPAYTEDEFIRYLQELPADVLLVSEAGCPSAEKAAVRLGIPVIRLMWQKSGENWSFTFRAPEGPIPAKQNHEQHSALEAAPSILLYTSGTIARPKLVPHSLDSILRSASYFSEAFTLRPSDRCLCVTPLFHAKAVIGIWPISLVSGASIIIGGRFEPQAALDLLQDLKATWYTAAASVHQALLGQMKATENFSHSLRFIRTCAAQTPLTLLADLEATLGVPCVEAYGMTETCARATSNPLPPGIRKPGSVGLPLNCEVRIMDAKGSPLPPYAIGEICIWSGQLMPGYRNDPEANQAAYFGKWFRTGDQGRLDEDGYLFLTGRLKELINRGGEKIAPVEIEEELLRHPDVYQAAAYAMPHPTLGEDVAACVTPCKGARLDPSELRHFVAEHLADFKVPSQIVVVDEIPKGPTGKILRIGLHEKIKALPIIASSQKQPGGETGLEAEILSIWREVMDNGALLPGDDFFALGGDSIRALRIAAQIKSKHGLSCTVSDVLLYPNVCDLAVKLAGRTTNS